MDITFSCVCGQQYTVPKSRLGKTATCTSCMAKIVVPDPDAEMAPNVVSLPPRQKRRKSNKPELSKDCPDGLEPINQDPEMHPVIVVILGLFIFMNGFEAATHLVYVPFMYAIGGVTDDAIDRIADEQLDDLDTTRVELKRTWRMTVACFILMGIAHLFVAGGFTGILLWKGYGIHVAAASAIVLLIVQVVFLEISKLGCANLPALATVVLLMKYQFKDAWNRLMGSNNSRKRRSDAFVAS